MVKRSAMATLAIFVTWTALDFLLHRVILNSSYMATAHLWRPEAEMKLALMHVVTLIIAAAFVALYAAFVSQKTLANGIKVGALVGVAMGASFGYGAYCVMPIPYVLAFSWFFGTLVEFVVAGCLVGLIVKS